MAALKSSLARAGTMELTANEGIDYLKSARKHTLLKFQGLIEDNPKVKRDNTMEAATKEAEFFFGGDKPDADAQTRSQQKRIVKFVSDDSSPEPPKKKMRLVKNSTMKVTAKESKYLLSGTTLSRTRQKTRQSRVGRPAVKRTSTMVKTLEEAKYVLYGHSGVNDGVKTRTQRSQASPRIFL